MTLAWLAVGLLLLFVGGEMLVRGASDLAFRLGLRPLFIGLTVVAFGTSAPELAVTVSAARTGLTDIAMGNVVGSNIANIALILAIASLIRPIRSHSRLVSHEIPAMVLASVLLLYALSDGVLSRPEGVLFLICMAAYMTLGILDARKLTPEEIGSANLQESRSPIRPLVAVALVVAGCLALAFGGKLLVDAASEVARALGVSEAVIGLTLVAVGTSLPELATTGIASLRGEGDLAIGNVVGSNIFNILIVLGIPASVIPLEMGDVRWIDLAVMMGLAILLFPLARTGTRIARGEGALLLALYAAYIAWQTILHG